MKSSKVTSEAFSKGLLLLFAHKHYRDFLDPGECPVSGKKFLALCSQCASHLEGVGGFEVVFYPDFCSFFCGFSINGINLKTGETPEKVVVSGSESIDPFSLQPESELQSRREKRYREQFLLFPL